MSHDGAASSQSWMMGLWDLSHSLDESDTPTKLLGLPVAIKLILIGSCENSF